MISSYKLLNEFPEFPEFPEDSEISKRSYWKGRFDSYDHCMYTIHNCNFDPKKCSLASDNFYSDPSKFID